ncbi:S8 family serine peptidase [Parashewanella tropica]|uniref:S8 family serine peptidase n=1 Tax=Parashewanella tropica TaxID=2547970 RepID=UPI00105A5333|nr:S8 family serine peptidase [Parashewanella tropica]
MVSINKHKALLIVFTSTLCFFEAYANAQITHLKQQVPAQYIIKFKDSPTNIGTGSKTIALSTEQLAKNTINQLNLTSAKPINHYNAYTSRLSAKQLAKLKNNPNVEYIEPDYPKYFVSDQLGSPSDTTLTATDVNWEANLLKTKNISDKDASNRTLCIIDSGYAINHPALMNNNVSGIDITHSGTWDNPSISHGSHVAGIIAAMQPNNPTNDRDVRGIMPNGQINIFVVKVSDQEGNIFTSNVVKAVDSCVEYHTNVITISLESANPSKLEEQAYKRAQKAGAIIVAAAGNSADTSKSYPASYNEVISVASVDSKQAHSAFSQTNSQVEISAPGEAILSSVIPGDGRLADIKVDKQSYFVKGVVPQERKIPNKIGGFSVKDINGTFTGTLAICHSIQGRFKCGNMTNSVCLIQRAHDQQRIPPTDNIEDTYPEIQPVMACQNAGAKAAIVYSSNQYPGLQNPFLVDDNNSVTIPTVSVSKTTGTELKSLIGKDVTVSVKPHQDYQYYNGTSMATPYVAAVSTLVWSRHPECSASQVRQAIDASATHLGSEGRNPEFGYGLINGQNLNKLLEQSCGVN